MPQFVYCSILPEPYASYVTVVNITLGLTTVNVQRRYQPPPVDNPFELNTQLTAQEAFLCKLLYLLVNYLDLGNH